jgi:hypothetical protein
MTLSHSIPAAMTASLPIIPLEIRRYHATLHPTDSRFAAAARLLQALWREERGWPMGTLDTPVGPLPLGSRLRDDYARAGANFLSRKVAERVRLELAYRRPGALYDERRVWANLLASQPLAFNLLVPLQLDPGLATAFFRRLLPDLGLDTVLEIGFEHTPGRRDPRFLGDGTALDALVTYRTPQGRRGFIALELKYAEPAPAGGPATTPYLDELALTSGLYADPLDPALCAGGLRQLRREHLLAWLLCREGYDEGCFVLLAPGLNDGWITAGRTYEQRLAPAGATVPFRLVALEEAVAAVPGGGEPAAFLEDRYLAFGKVHQLVLGADLPPLPASEHGDAVAQVAMSEPSPRHRPVTGGKATSVRSGRRSGGISVRRAAQRSLTR